MDHVDPDHVIYLLEYFEGRAELETLEDAINANIVVVLQNIAGEVSTEFMLDILISSVQELQGIDIPDYNAANDEQRPLSPPAEETFGRYFDETEVVECCVCLDDVWKTPDNVAHDNHYLCAMCRESMRAAECPLCRIELDAR